MATIFLKLANDENREKKHFAIEESKMETLNVCESYDQYGQKIGPDDAGDYLEILTQEAADKANEIKNNFDDYDTTAPDDEAPKPRFSIGDNVLAYNDRDIFLALVEEFEDEKEIRIHRTKFQGFVYHDGHNWRTVSVSTIDDDNEYELEGNEEIIARLNEALENKEEHSTGPGKVTYRYKDAEIVKSSWPGNWEQYTITLNNDFEEEEG